MQQSSLQQPNSQSATQPPQRALLNKSEIKSDYCSLSSDKPLQVKIRPPLKIRKPDINKFDQTTTCIPISVEQTSSTSQLLSKFQKCKQSRNNLDLPEAKISSSRPLKDSKVHAEHSFHPIEDTGSSKTKCMLQIDHATHTAINQLHQKHPIGNDVHVSENVQHKTVTTQNLRLTIENKEQ